MMNAPQSTEMPGQQDMPMQQGFPMQYSYGMYNDMYAETNMTGMLPATASPGDPPPLLSNNPATTNIVLFKELTAYPNYGNPSRNADILYTGNRGTWTFQTPAFLFVPGNLRAQIIIRAVLDDHANVDVSRYSARITVNGTVVHNGRVSLNHGVPAGGIFTNWRELTFNIPILRRTSTVTIENTSTTGVNDWIGLDWMEIRLFPR
jgi:hypothetical protein